MKKSVRYTILTLMSPFMVLGFVCYAVAGLACAGFQLGGECFQTQIDGTRNAR